jgi:cytidine diphosphoramidate kinase
MVIWVTGVSGSGKTTIANKVYKTIKFKNKNTVYLDGDEFRSIFNNDLGYELEDRDINAVRMTRLCQFLSEQKINIVCGANLTSQYYRDWCRENIKNYFEVHIEVPLNVLIDRDIKNLYRKAIAGDIANVVGVDIPFKQPKNADMIIDNTAKISDFSEIVDSIISESQKLYKYS